MRFRIFKDGELKDAETLEEYATTGELTMDHEDRMRQEVKQHLEDCMRALVVLVQKLNTLPDDPRWAAELRVANIQIARARTFAATGAIPQGEL